MLTVFWAENLKGRDYSEDLGVDGKIILELILRKLGVERCGLDSSGSVQGPVAGSCEHGNEPWGSKRREIS
jgi:hypothetical protein